VVGRVLLQDRRQRRDEPEVAQAGGQDDRIGEGSAAQQGEDG
jgi:hypothetical protein